MANWFRFKGCTAIDNAGCLYIEIETKSEGIRRFVIHRLEYQQNVERGDILVPRKRIERAE